MLVCSLEEFMANDVKFAVKVRLSAHGLSRAQRRSSPVRAEPADGARGGQGATKRIRVCTRCLRGGKVTKAALSAPGDFGARRPEGHGRLLPAVRAGNLLFISGQIPINPATGELVSGSITAEAEQVMRNLSALLKAAGLGFEHVVRTTVFLPT
jgi:enamine deaminase RidA (YjgF/YER057c/UK114 family)